MCLAGIFLLVLGGSVMPARAQRQEQRRAAAPAPQKAGESAVEDFNAGIKSLQEERYDDAIAAFSRVIAANPRDTQAYMFRGIAKEQKNADMQGPPRDTTGAMADLNRAIEIAPGNQKAFESRAHVKERLGDIDGALADLDLAVRVNPRSYFSIYSTRASLRKVKGDNAGALSDLMQARSLVPKDEGLAPEDRGKSHMILSSLDNRAAWLCILTNQPKKAIARAEEATQFFPDDLDARTLLAHAYLLDGQYDKALATYREIEHADPARFRRAVAELSSLPKQGIDNPDIAKMAAELGGGGN